MPTPTITTTARCLRVTGSRWSLAATETVAVIGDNRARVRLRLTEVTADGDLVAVPVGEHPVDGVLRARQADPARRGRRLTAAVQAFSILNIRSALRSTDPSTADGHRAPDPSIGAGLARRPSMPALPVTPTSGQPRRKDGSR